MKQFIFNEDDDISLDQISEKLFMNMDTCDPASIYYKRHLDRPEINWIRILIHTSIPIIIFMIIISVFLYIGMGSFFSIIISCSILLSYLFLSLKKILIFFIHIYQHFAPDSIRMKCRFEPSCSQYMILAIEKYGVTKGIKTGIKRLQRCKTGNGGYDYP